jgi:hypothetical protein
MKWSDLYDPEPTTRSERESKLRLFEQLHQSPEHEDMVYAGIWRRANWFLLCELCQLPYGEHPWYDEYSLGDQHRELTDHRLCNGDVVHP